jgi:prepilin-type N-terminal cleavage/methylation domain-containing protein
MISEQSRKSSQGFTLIEMIGVLAVIAILASMLIPKIFEAINSARINTAVQGYNSIKTAVMDHYGKYGAIATLRGTNTIGLPINDYDRSVLLPEALIDKPFATRVATTNLVEVVAGLTAADAVTGANASYDLDGSGTTVNDAAPAAAVVQVLINQVAISDAQEISQRIDGTNLSEAPGATTQDLRGRVKYATPVNGLTDVYVYIAHR